MNRRLSLGLDFGTESVRAVLVDVEGGALCGQGVHEYAHGVLDTRLREGGPRLPADFALQVPQDYLDSMTTAVRAAMREASADAADVVGIGVDFTACTMLPVDADGRPLCEQDRFHDEPHAYVKLWKHHGANEQAERINRTARARGESWLERYGGTISSEWLLPKAWETLERAPEVYAAADRFLEASDWVVSRLSGPFVRGACAAGYKGLSSVDEATLAAFVLALDPRLTDLYSHKVRGPVLPAGTRAGELEPEFAAALGLREGTPVSAPVIDAHAAVPGAGMLRAGQLVLILGTSSCHMLLGDREVLVPGIQGVVRDGILPGFFAYEAGQASSGDMLDWWVERILGRVGDEAAAHRELTAAAAKLGPGGSGLLALDWWNGNRSILVDPWLSGLLIGMTKSTEPADIYRALLEASAFGTRCILENFSEHGVDVDEILLCGGMAEKNVLLPQVYADVTGRPLRAAASPQVCALGAAVFGALAAGARGGGYDVIADAATAMVPAASATFTPDAASRERYDELYQLWIELHDHFGRKTPETMARLRRLRDLAESMGEA